MARNGSGVYNLPTNSWNPATNGVSATAVDWQNLINDVASALTQSLSADGQTPITGNLAMSNNKLTGLAAGSATGDSLRWEQLFSQGQPANLPSAATTDIGLQNTVLLNITGTTTITSFGTNYNGPRYLRFDGVLTLTHNATTLILPGGANITTAAGDSAIVVPNGTPANGWRVVGYQRADGTLPTQNSVATSNIQDQAITAVKLAQNSVLTANIQDQQVTTIKLADGAANGVKLGSKIQSLTATNNAGALTISASALSLDFRSTTLSVGTPGTVIGTPANLVIPAGATLGTINGVQSDLIVLAINNAGTIELAVVNLSGGNQLDETNLISTTAISAGSTSASVIYSTTARSNVAYRVLGLLRSTQSTAGSWTTTQSLLQGYGGQALSALSSIGYGQTWQSVTRNSGTTYYNTTGKPIVLCGSTSSSTTVFITINGVQHGNCVTPVGANNYVSWVIPAGASYVVSGTLGTTLELR